MGREKTATQKFEEIRDEVDTLKDERSRLAGRQDELLKRLQTEFGCDTIKKAQKKLKNLDEEIEEKEEKFKKNLEEFEEKWDEEL